jgi:hypothetical protein
MNSINDTSMCSHTQSNRSRTLVHVALAFLCMPFWACGGSSSSPSAPTPVVVAPTPQPCAQTIVFQGSGEMPSGTLLNFPVSPASAGRLDITADWTFATNPVGLYVIQGACSLEQFNARSCTFAARVEPGAKPIKASANVQTGNYTVLVANFGARDDSGALQIVLSTGSCPAAAAPSAASGAPIGLEVHRARRFTP